MRVMTGDEIASCTDVGLRIADAMRRELTSVPLCADQMHSALAIATTLVVSFGSMQKYLEVLAECAAAKEVAMPSQPAGAVN